MHPERLLSVLIWRTALNCRVDGAMVEESTVGKSRWDLVD